MAYFLVVERGCLLPLLYYCEGPVAGNRPTVGSRDGIFPGG